jgi:hypothetical protein
MEVKILIFILIFIVILLYIYYEIIKSNNSSSNNSSNNSSNDNIEYDEYINNVIIGTNDLKTWTKTTPTRYTFWYDIIFGNGIYVSVGDSHKNNEPNIITSNNTGTLWTPINVGNNLTLYSIIYNNNQFVAVGESNNGDNIITSNDGISWTLIKASTNTVLNAIVYGDKYVAVGNKILTSTDLTNWTTRDFSDTLDLYGITYKKDFTPPSGGAARSVYVAVGNNILISDDGAKWTIQEYSTNLSVIYFRVIFGRDKFIAVGNKGNIIYSTDLIKWTNIIVQANTNWWDIKFINDKFIIVGESITLTSPNIMTSSDGINWIANDSNDKTLFGVTYGNNKYITVGY